jgi:hypothetical protein
MPLWDMAMESICTWHFVPGYSKMGTSAHKNTPYGQGLLKKFSGFQHPSSESYPSESAKVPLLSHA